MYENYLKSILDYALEQTETSHINVLDDENLTHDEQIEIIKTLINKL